METKKADILQIRKYLNGELDAKAMHRLEREALDDPFLMDALEGFETVPTNQQANLADLSSRLQQRVEPPQKGRVIAWRTWVVAASVLLVLTIGGLWLKKAAPVQENKQLALNKDNAVVIPATPDNTKVELKDTGVAKPPIAPSAALLANNTPKHFVVKQADKSVYQQEISASDNKNAEAVNADELKKMAQSPQPAAEYKSENSALSEIVALNYNDKKADTLAMLAKKAREKAAAPLESKLQGKVEGLTTITSRESNSGYSYNSISGIIRAKDDGAPVIGAAIRMQGTNKSTVTDANGYFAMPATAGKKATLEIASIGYQPKQISAKSGDSLKVELNPNGALNEVVAVGYGSKKNSEDEPASIVSAHPQGGMSTLKKYLQTNAVLPDGDVAGTVSVTFTVANDGSLSDFKIKKSLSPVADQKAIDLIKAGPTWVANSNGNAEQVTVKVKFFNRVKNQDGSL
ncbi:carboxypeptidase-like regulatory domain-containing protein [Mucilaginibacter flavus]|uniref:carboxypeptidase-like regulatory domain-containing protein n=1 Tax=Mucilaginibacter flavus TaxID=931504 RepID=UPI0025B438FD|nr:carboxypeptidase-like regulatory domain-containing protein [Mucilaginibacter flavus]MDN3582321.1 carboxypeptidase-like regulatory domain-containing protein [Mucilaginibacter flavus]